MLHRSQRRLHGIDHIGNLCQWFRRLVHILQKGLNGSHCHHSVYEKLSSYHCDQHLPHPVYEPNGRVDGLGKKIGFSGFLCQLLRRLADFLTALLFRLNALIIMRPLMLSSTQLVQPAQGPLASGRSL